MGNTIDVILPVFNGENYLAETIQSVLSQTYKNVSLIVIDDGSTDNTDKIVQRYDHHINRVHSPINQGPAAAMNLGISKAQGDFLAFIDADDLWDPDKLTIQMNYFLQDNSLDMVFCNIKQFISPELSASDRSRIYCPDKAGYAYSKISMLIRRISFDKVGFFPSDRKFGEFVDWASRARELKLNYLVLDEILAFRRLHKSNLSITHSNERSDFIHVLKKSLDRRRLRNDS